MLMLALAAGQRGKDPWTVQVANDLVPLERSPNPVVAAQARTNRDNMQSGTMSEDEILAIAGNNPQVMQARSEELRQTQVNLAQEMRGSTANWVLEVLPAHERRERLETQNVVELFRASNDNLRPSGSVRATRDEDRLNGDQLVANRAQGLLQRYTHG